MIRATCVRLYACSRVLTCPVLQRLPTATQIPARKRSYIAKSEEDFDNRYIEYFNNPDIDPWQLRTGFNNLIRCDVVPEPTIVTAALRACRRLNDHSAAVRMLEAIRCKCGNRDDLYGWVIQEIQPVLDELSISPPAEMGYHESELWLEDVNDMHGSDEPPNVNKVQDHSKKYGIA